MTSPQTLRPITPYGSMLKQPRERRQKSIRKAREADVSYLALIRSLPCLKCGMEPCEAAHVRMQSAAHGKTGGIGMRPDDKWALPLCAACHRIDKDSQHNIGEQLFWHQVGLNPLFVCEELYAASPNIEMMRAVVVRFTATRK